MVHLTLILILTLTLTLTLTRWDQLLDLGRDQSREIRQKAERLYRDRAQTREMQMRDLDGARTEVLDLDGARTDGERPAVRDEFSTFESLSSCI